MPPEHMSRTPLILLLVLLPLVLTVCLAAAAAASSSTTTSATNLFDSDVDLPELPYAYDALEPVIDRRTMEVHHGAHHRAYTNNFNTALSTLRSAAEGEHAAHLRRCVTVEDLLRTLSSAGLPESLSSAVRNQGGGYYNHMLWWRMMTSPQNHEAHPQPRGKLRDAIVSGFGSLEAFQSRFSQLAKTHFGSGWVWLYLAPATDGPHTLVDSLANQQQKKHHHDGGGQLTLHIGSFPNQDPPLLDRSRVYPVLGIDVWEHAHYLKYENRRPDYVDAWWGVVNWEYVEQLYEEALQRDGQQ